MFDNDRRVIAKVCGVAAYWTSQMFAWDREHMDAIEVPAAVRLIEQRRKARGMAVRSVAPEAALSEGRWRQIAKGFQSAKGIQIPATAPDSTVARMAVAVGVSSTELEAVDERDIAALVRETEVGRLRHPSRASSDLQASGAALSLIPDDALLAELGRRLDERASTVRQLHVVDAPQDDVVLPDAAQHRESAQKGDDDFEPR